MKIALYARVSTKDQSCEMQLRELREYAARNNWSITKEYVDHGFSGKKASRPQLNQLMADAAKRNFDAVLVWKLDRFGRSLMHIVQSIHELSHYGVRFITSSQPIDTDGASPMGKLMLQLLAAFAEFERELIAERTSAGIARARSEGKTIGKPRKVFDRALAAKLRNDGLSYRAISAQLGVAKTTIVESLNAN
jgi:DNA invertase Pin-like site-specific DNA recombinase